MRQAFVIVHRYVGLTIASFLMVAGITGSALSFLPELETMISPQLMRVEAPSSEAVMLDPFVLRERAQKALGVSLHEVTFNRDPGESVSMWLEPLDPGTNTTSATADNEYFFDPFTGALLGSRHWGDLSQGVVNLMPFVCRLHYQLALGEVGEWLLGIIALLWTIDCFIGMYLTFPTQRSATGKEGSWLARWKSSWLIKGSRLFSAVFTFHRASGLWAWPLLLVFAWSAVGFNLRPLFRPVMSLFGTVPNVWEHLPELKQPKEVPRLDWHEAHRIGQQLMEDQANATGFTVIAASRLTYRIVVCIMGLIVALLCVTGVIIWWKKRRVRVRAGQRIGLTRAASHSASMNS